MTEHGKTERADLLISVFGRLRHRVRSLGVGDLLDALRLVEGGWEFGSMTELKQDVRLLWCRSFAESSEFNRIWEECLSQPQPPETTPGERNGQWDRDYVPEEYRESRAPASQPASEQEAIKPREPLVTALPLKAPPNLAVHAGPMELSLFRPISRRTIAYGWQFLRRSRADGPATALDLNATIEETARLGFFLRPVYKPEMRNHSQLILLVDREGSMTPHHYLARDVIETAQQAPTLGQVQVFYFHNVIGESVHLDPHLTEQIDWDKAFSNCHRDTNLIIVSDAGAARCRRSIERIEATEEMLFRLRQSTPHIAWLNPWRESRWQKSSAQFIARLVPMFSMDKIGFNAAIKVVRGMSHRAFG